jgi:hypothetical protein
MRLGDLAVSPSILPLTASTVLAASAIKTSIATSASGAIYAGAALNGATVTAGVSTPAPSGLVGVAQYPIAVAASNAGSYVVNSTVIFSGTRDGKTATSTATVTSADGNLTYVGNNPLDTCTGITVGAQANTSGAWTFGYTDVACPRRGGCDEPFRMLRPTSTGNVVIVDGSGRSVTVPVVSGGPDELVDIYRVKFSSTSTTVTTLNLYE